MGLAYQGEEGGGWDCLRVARRLTEPIEVDIGAVVEAHEVLLQVEHAVRRVVFVRDGVWIAGVLGVGVHLRGGFGTDRQSSKPFTEKAHRAETRSVRVSKPSCWTGRLPVSA